MKKQQLLAIAVALFVLPSTYAGQTFTYPAENPIFEITYPEDWVVEQDGEVLTAGPESSGLSSVLMAVAGDDLESAIDGANQGLAETFGEYTLSDPSEGILNGMPVVFLNGNGSTPDGVSLDLSCAIFSPDGSTFFMLFIFAGGDISDEDSAKMNSILQSIKGS